MKKLTNINTSLLLIPIFLFLPAMSSAQSLGTSLITEIDTVVETNGDLYTTMDTEMDLGADADAGINIIIDEQPNVDMRSENNINVNFRTNTSGVAITSSAQVSSEEDLSVFSRNASLKAHAVSNVAIGQDEDLAVTVAYKHKAKLFGFIPTNITSRTTIEAKANSEAQVRSKLSWWSFLVTGENYSKAEIESRIKSNAMVSANAKANVSNSARAQIAEAIIAELEAHADAQAQLEAGANL
jgi:hypothetical protein